MENIEKIMSIYDEYYNRTDGDGAVLSVLTLATIIKQQTEIIKILCSNVKHLDSTLSNIERYAADDLDARLGMIASRISETEQILYDTLGSSRTGGALEAIIDFPDRLSDILTDLAEEINGEG